MFYICTYLIHACVSEKSTVDRGPSPGVHGHQEGLWAGVEGESVQNSRRCGDIRGNGRGGPNRCKNFDLYSK